MGDYNFEVPTAPPERGGAGGRQRPLRRYEYPGRLR